MTTHSDTTPYDADAAHARHRDLLARILRDFFGVADEDVVAEIEDHLDFVQLAANGTLFEQGDEARGVYFLLSGRLRAVQRDENDHERVLGEVARGETVGELALVTGETRGATVMAVRASVLARLPREDFETVLLGRPRVALTLMRTVVDRFRRQEATRRQPARPINICFLPVSDGIDMRAFVRSFARHLTDYVNPVGVLTRDDFEDAAATGIEDRERFLKWLREREAHSESVLLVAEGKNREWTRLCAQHADEIVLVARGDADGALSFAEEIAQPDGDHGSVAQRTLVLLHPSDAPIPRDTARWFRHRSVSRHLNIRSDRERDMQRLVRTLSGRAVGLVLAGGGARGLAHIGVARAFEEAGFHFDILGGTSIGAVMSGIIASDIGAEGLSRMARSIFVDAGNPTNDYNLLPMVSLIKAKKAFERTHEAMEREFGRHAIDVEDLWLPWFAIAADYYTGAQTVLSRGDVSRNIFASLAIPGAFPPMVVERRLYVDGGTVNNMPVDVMERQGAGVIVAVDLASDFVREVDYDWVPSGRQILVDRFRPRAKRRHEVPSLPEVLLNASVLHSISHQKRMRERADLCVRPNMRGVGLLDWKRFDTAVERGREAALRALDEMTPEEERRLRGVIA